MNWQDLVLSAGSIFFCLALLPTVTDRRAAVPRFTSVTTALWLLVFAATQATMGLRIAPICEAFCAALWAWITVSRAPMREMPRFMLDEEEVVRQLNQRRKRADISGRWTLK